MTRFALHRKGKRKMTTSKEIHERSVARCLKAVELRHDGMTFKEIGEVIGTNGPVTVETARQAFFKGERILARRSQSETPSEPERGEPMFNYNGDLIGYAPKTKGEQE
jgi:hypothetical protein